MYVINGIPEFQKMGTGIPIFNLNGFRVFRFDFPPESSGIPNSEAEFRIPVVPAGNGISKRNSQPSCHVRLPCVLFKQRLCSFRLFYLIKPPPPHLPLLPCKAICCPLQPPLCCWCHVASETWRLISPYPLVILLLRSHFSRTVGYPHQHHTHTCHP